MTHESITHHRAAIDAIDAELLRLLNRRAAMASALLALKRAAGLPICDPERELEVLTRAAGENPGPLSKRAVLRIFRQIVEETRKAEEHEAEHLSSAGKASR